MNTIKKILSVAGAGAVAAGILAGAAHADAVADRQAAMKNIGGAMKMLAAIARKKAPFDAAVVKKNAEVISTNFTAAGKLFGKGTEKGEKETYAKPEVFSDSKGFMAALKKGIDAANGMAGVTEEGKFMPALIALGGACKGCHKGYRRPKE